MILEDLLLYPLIIAVGFILGLLGSGGSILSLPILIYIAKTPPSIASSYSLFIVGVASFAGALRYILKGSIDLKSVVIFGGPSIVTVYLVRRYLLSLIPHEIYTSAYITLTKEDVFLLFLVFLMLFCGILMLKVKTGRFKALNIKGGIWRYISVVLKAIGVGGVTGIVGVGGGFLIVPSLFFFLGVPLKLAVGTSLSIVSLQAFLGLLGDMQSSSVHLDYFLLIRLVVFTVVGMLLGAHFSSKITKQQVLSTYFAYTIIVIAIVMFFNRIFLIIN